MLRRRTWVLVVVAGLGYFVDIYDLVLFSILRTKSLQDLGARDVFGDGVHLIAMQMGGFLLGGILWGVLGDKRGRVSVLFGSILLYSLANIGNAFVGSVDAYAWLRLLAGLGLAGELGAGITLVAEVMPRESRGWGTTAVATLGILGAIVAALLGDALTWRHSYVVGGALGLALLALRVGAFESGLFERVAATRVPRGSFLALFSSRERASRYLCVVLCGLPIWYVVAILVTFAPEVGGALGMDPAPSAGRAILWCYAGLATGDLASGALSQALASRRRVVLLFLALTAGAIAAYFLVGPRSMAAFLGCCFLLGVATGYWAVFVTIASEQFGTNLRATVTTTAPNFVRGSVVPVTWLFHRGKDALGVPGSALALGALILAVAFLATWRLRETFARDLDFVDAD